MNEAQRKQVEQTMNDRIRHHPFAEGMSPQQRDEAAKSAANNFRVGNWDEAVDKAVNDQLFKRF